MEESLGISQRCSPHVRTFLGFLTIFAVLFAVWSVSETHKAKWRQEPVAAVKNTDGVFDSRAGVGTVAAESVTNTIGMKLILVPAGEFMMGNSLTAADEIAQFKKYGVDDLNADCFKIEYPRHRVRISRPFYLGAYHVTRGQFRRFVEDTGYKTDAEKGDDPGANGVDLEKGTFFGFQKNRSWHDVTFQQADDHPVVNVSWNDAVAFCEWLSRKEGKTYRLPTEAEWEYACRAGTSTRYWCGNNPETLAEAANTADAELKARFPGGSGPAIRAKDGYVFTSPVGSFRANPFGLYDMHGNAWQWCADWCGGRYYEQSPVDDPTGPATGAMRILRGGAWNFGPIDCRSAQRIALSPASRNDHSGFRVVLERGNLNP